ncbi:hypothetical protein ACQJBY_054430 [Aegilops geniculata]
MLMVGLAPCAFSLTESDYSRRKKAMGTCRPQSFLSTNPSVQVLLCAKKAHTPHHCSRATISKQNVQKFYGLQFTQPSPGCRVQEVQRHNPRSFSLAVVDVPRSNSITSASLVKQCDLRNHGGRGRPAPQSNSA